MACFTRLKKRRSSKITSKYKHAICWVRRDLRVSDHHALAEATAQSENVTVVFIFDTTILSKLKDKDDKRITFIHQSLQELDLALKKHGSQIIVRKGDPRDEIPKLAKALNVNAVFANRDYEPSAILRDKAIKNSLLNNGIQFHDFKDHVIFEGDEIKKADGTPYKVFTPYKFSWIDRFDEVQDAREYKPILKKLTPIKILKKYNWDWGLENVGFKRAVLWLNAGEAAAKKRLGNFKKRIDDYKENRNIPSLNEGTSGLSVHLRFGTISIRECVRFARQFRSQGARVWLSELIWREFYQMILHQFPYVVNGCFKKECDDIKWPGLNAHFEKWKEGKTGYPLVDAAMRHFKETGWMHNRLRMVVAGFLTKDLLVDWRKGEAWFAQKLLDFDLASNNGGWQWSASTGCDAQPYFRIFNPITQSERFDPHGKFIRENVVELKDCADKIIHWPHIEPLLSNPSYPPPIVDHAIQRVKAMMLFKKLK